MYAIPDHVACLTALTETADTLAGIAPSLSGPRREQADQCLEQALRCMDQLLRAGADVAPPAQQG